MVLFAVILILLLGFGLILIEFFITPGFIVGLIGFACLAYAIYFGYQHLPTWQAHTTLAVTVLFGIIMTIKLFTGKTYERFAIKETIDSRVNEKDKLNLSIGEKGTTLSALRPSGNALFGEIRVEVTTEGDFVYTNTNIEIIKIEKDKIFVKPI